MPVRVFLGNMATVMGRDPVRFAEAPVKGMSVLKYDPDGKAAYAYRALAKEVLGNGKRR